MCATPSYPPYSNGFQVFNGSGPAPATYGGGYSVTFVTPEEEVNKLRVQLANAEAETRLLRGTVKRLQETVAKMRKAKR